MSNLLNVLPGWARPRLESFAKKENGPIDHGGKVRFPGSAGEIYAATIEDVALDLRDKVARLDGSPADLEKAKGFVKMASGYQAAYQSNDQGVTVVVSPQGEHSDSVLYYRLSAQETSQALLEKNGLGGTVVQVLKPDMDGWLIQKQDGGERPSLTDSPWKVPTVGSSRDLGRQAIRLLAGRNVQSPETYSGAMIPSQMDKAVLVHEFPLENFGSIAFHGFLSTAEACSDKFLAHKERLLKPQEMLNVELDLSAESHRKLLPTYTFCVVPERPVALGYPESTDYPLTYGEVEAVLRKEVQQRSSWSYGDSLSLHASSGPRSRAHTFQETSLRRDMVQSTNFIEAQVWGELTLADVDHFVLPDWMSINIEKQREQLRTGQSDGSPLGQDFLETTRQQVDQFDRFLDTCRLLEIPVHTGDTRSRLTRTHDETGAEVSPAFKTDRVLVRGLPAVQRPRIDPTRLQSILGRPEDQSGSQRILPQGLFQPGASREEQVKAFVDFQEANLKERIRTSG